VLTAWLLFQASFIAIDSFWALGEVKGQWINSMIAFAVASFLGLYSLNRGMKFQQSLYVVLFLALFLHVVYVDVVAIGDYIRAGGGFARVSGLAEGPHQANYVTNMLFAFLVAEVIMRFRTGRHLLPVGQTTLVLFFLLTGLSFLFEGMRNGLMSVIAMLLVAVALTSVDKENYNRRGKWVGLLLLMVSLVIFAGYSIKHDRRWSSLFDTIPIALDTENNNFWLNHKKYTPPVLPDGDVVNLSNYLRIAWAKEGIKMVIEHPLGVGYGRESFAQGLMPKYGERALLHSHSGLLEMAIGGGIPGFILWLLFIMLLVIYSYRAFRRGIGFPASFALLYTGCFFARSIVDFNTKNHVLVTFFFLIGLMAMLILHEKKYSISSAS